MGKRGPKPAKSHWTDDELVAAVLTSKSRSGVFRKLKYPVSSTAYRWLYRDAERLGLDLTHLVRDKNGQFIGANRLPVETRLISPGSCPSDPLKKLLWRDGLKERKCEWCGITEWRGLPAPLELDHIDGDKRNNLLENLRILCRNCHGQTETFAGKNVGRYAVSLET